jgi:uncharacterized membrane protein YiaA
MTNLAVVRFNFIAPTEQEAQRDDDFISLCRLVLLLSAGLLLVGAWFVPAPWREKSIYVMAWFVCM